MKIKIFSLLIASVLAFTAIAGCASKTPPDDGDGGNSTVVPQKPDYSLPSGEAEGDYVLSDSGEAYSEDFELAVNSNTENVILNETIVNSSDRAFCTLSNGGFTNTSVDAETVRKRNFNGTLFELGNLSIPRSRLKFEVQAKFQSVPNISSDNIGELRIYDSEGNAVLQLGVRYTDFGKTGMPVTAEIYGTVYENLNGASFAYVCYPYETPYTVISVNITAVSENEYFDADLRDEIYSEADLDIDLGFNEDNLYYFDITAYIPRFRSSKDQYDIFALITTIQGLVNRRGANFFVKAASLSVVNGYVESIDDFWFDELTSGENYFSGRNIVELTTLNQVLVVFEEFYKGLVVWDENVPATTNAAATASGVDELLPVRFNSSPDSLMNILRTDYELDVKINLNGKFTGDGNIYQTEEATTSSAKNDAYIWALNRYLESGRCNFELLSNHMDSYSLDYEQKGVSHFNMYCYYLAQRDYSVKNKAFFFDLSAWPDKIPTDDPDQKLTADGVTVDYTTFSRMLKYCNSKTQGDPIRVGGYVPFTYKYTYPADGVGLDYSDVQAEGAWATLYGYYGAYKIVDDRGLANVSLYSEIGIDSETVYQTGNTEKYKSSVLENKNYIYVYMGDFDASSWVNDYLVMMLKNDSTLGDIPLSYGLSPAVMERVPHAYNYVFNLINNLPEEKKENIYWVAPNNGFGYSYISYLTAEDRPEGLYGSADQSLKYASDILKDYGVDIMGFLIEGTTVNGVEQKASAELQTALAKYFPKGVIYSSVAAVRDRVTDTGVPTIGMCRFHSHSSLDNLRTENDFIHNLGLTPNPDKPYFIAIRCVLMNPSSLSRVNKKLQSSEFQSVFNAEFVDPYTFMHLYKQAVLSDVEMKY